MTQAEDFRARVLVVDDDASLSEMLSIVLRQEGFDSHVVERGDEAMEAFHAYRPDVVLLDLMLPGTAHLLAARSQQVSGWHASRDRYPCMCAAGALRGAPASTTSTRRRARDNKSVVDAAERRQALKTWPGQDLLPAVRAGRRTGNQDDDRRTTRKRDNDKSSGSRAHSAAGEEGGGESM